MAIENVINLKEVVTLLAVLLCSAHGDAPSRKWFISSEGLKNLTEQTTGKLYPAAYAAHDDNLNLRFPDGELPQQSRSSTAAAAQRGEAEAGEGSSRAQLEDGSAAQSFMLLEHDQRDAARTSGTKKKSFTAAQLALHDGLQDVAQMNFAQGRARADEDGNAKTAVDLAGIAQPGAVPVPATRTPSTSTPGGSSFRLLHDGREFSRTLGRLLRSAKSSIHIVSTFFDGGFPILGEEDETESRNARGRDEDNMGTSTTSAATAKKQTPTLREVLLHEVQNEVVSEKWLLTSPHPDVGTMLFASPTVADLVRKEWDVHWFGFHWGSNGWTNINHAKIFLIDAKHFIIGGIDPFKGRFSPAAHDLLTVDPLVTQERQDFSVLVENAPILGESLRRRLVRIGQTLEATPRAFFLSGSLLSPMATWNEDQDRWLHTASLSARDEKQPIAIVWNGPPSFADERRMLTNKLEEMIQKTVSAAGRNEPKAAGSGERPPFLYVESQYFQMAAGDFCGAGDGTDSGEPLPCVFSQQLRKAATAERRRGRKLPGTDGKKFSLAITVPYVQSGNPMESAGTWRTLQRLEADAAHRKYLARCTETDDRAEVVKSGRSMIRTRGRGEREEHFSFLQTESQDADSAEIAGENSGEQKKATSTGNCGRLAFFHMASAFLSYGEALEHVDGDSNTDTSLTFTRNGLSSASSASLTSLTASTSASDADPDADDDHEDENPKAPADVDASLLQRPESQTGVWKLEFYGVYVHTKMLISSSEGTLISSANVNQRSLAGTGDLETGVYLANCTEQCADETVLQYARRNGCGELDETSVSLVQFLTICSDRQTEKLRRLLSTAASSSADAETANNAFSSRPGLRDVRAMDFLEASDARGNTALKLDVLSGKKVATFRDLNPEAVEDIVTAALGAGWSSRIRSTIPPTATSSTSSSSSGARLRIPIFRGALLRREITNSGNSFDESDLPWSERLKIQMLMNTPIPQIKAEDAPGGVGFAFPDVAAGNGEGTGGTLFGPRPPPAPHHDDFLTKNHRSGGRSVDASHQQDVAGTRSAYDEHAASSGTTTNNSPVLPKSHVDIGYSSDGALRLLEETKTTRREEEFAKETVETDGDGYRSGSAAYSVFQGAELVTGTSVNRAPQPRPSGSLFRLLD